VIHCKTCNSDHDGWDMATCRRRRNTNTSVPALLQKSVLDVPSGPVLPKKPKKTINTPVNTVNTDRHKPGYMAEYMKKRRAK